MEYKLSNANIEVPNMIYGTAWKKYSTTFLVKQAIIEGFKGIDTACQPKHYNEELVGKGLQEAYKAGKRRENLYIQTKFTPIEAQDPTNMPYLEKDSLTVQIEKSFEKSKENLKTDFIDSYILHSPIYPAKKLLSAWDTMSGFYKNKEVGQIGISNCYELDVLKYLYERVDVKPAVLQNRFYAETSYDTKIREWCDEKGIIYQSFWSLTANPHILSDKNVMKMALKYKKNEATIFYKFLNQIGIVPLNGTTSVEHMKEDLRISEFTLTQEEVDLIKGWLK